jgi:cellulose synthase/poly-beta-1,6-N-acetylglucosamine synthase-like glycosyltransferase
MHLLWVGFNKFLDFVQILAWSCLAFGGSYYSFLTIYSLKSREFLAANRPNKRHAPNQIDDALLPGVTLCMPAYNEEVVIVGCVSAALKSDYPNLEIVVVSDGSKDRTVASVVEAFNMRPDDGARGENRFHTKDIKAIYRCLEEPRLVVIDKAASGSKADAVNCAINFSRMPWVVIMDADELLNRDSVRKCMTEALHTPGNVVCVGTTLLPTNEGEVVDYTMVKAKVARNKWAGFQLVEYLSAFIMSRPGQAALGSLTFVSGGFGIYRRDILMEVGPLKHPSLGEDLDYAIRVHKHLREKNIPYVFLQVPEAIVWTEFPSTLKVLKRQRMRWHRGLREIMNDYRNLIGKRTYGRFGILSLGQLYMFEWLAPIIEAVGYVISLLLLVTGRVTPMQMFSIWAMSQSFGTLLSVVSVMTASRHIEEYQTLRDRLRLLKWAFLLQFGYRQLTLYWRVASLKKQKVATWGEMTRAGFGPAAAGKK